MDISPFIRVADEQPRLPNKATKSAGAQKHITIFK